jgi:hypothetical protein
MDAKQDYAILTGWLEERGHSQAEIEKILERVRGYEAEMQLDSLMDSIGKGSLSLERLIQEALGE